MWISQLICSQKANQGGYPFRCTGVPWAPLYTCNHFFRLYSITQTLTTYAHSPIKRTQILPLEIIYVLIERPFSSI